MEKNNLLKRIIKYIFVAIVIAILLWLVVFALKSILPGFIDVIKHGDENEIQEYIRSFNGFAGKLIVALMQFFQVISIILPGLPIQVAAGVIFGTFSGFVICHLSYVAANMTVFLLDRKIGRKFGDFVSEEKSQKKWQLISNSEYPWFMVILSCLIPLLPNGIIPYLAAHSKITFKQFLFSVYVGSFPAIFVLCSVGNKILSGNYTDGIILCASLFAVVIVLYIFRDKLVDAFDKFYRTLKSKSK